MHTNQPYTELYDEQGAPQGVWISPDVWERVAEAVLPLLREASGLPEPEPEFTEPLADWNSLKDYWDFPYPLTPSVTCGNCGATTADWQADDPRTFRLKSATFGGLVSFQCQACKARIIKRHFKDKVEEETVPYSD